MIVAELRRGDPVFGHLGADTGKAGGLVVHGHDDRHQVYVFESPTTFDAYCKRATTALLQTLLYEERTDAQRRHLVRAGLVLAGGDPALNALRVMLTPADRRDRSREIALKRVREEHQAAFKDILWALTTDKPEYVIKYKDGFSKGGGLDLNDAAKIVNSANATHEPFTGHMARVYPFLRSPPPPRLRDLKGAASAHFHFVANISGHPLGERVARLLELRLLEQSLAGELPPDLPDRLKVERALEVMLAPAEGTIVSHVRISGDEVRLDVEDLEHKRPRTKRSEPFIMLGYQVGLIRHADEVEITLSPPAGNRKGLMLRTSDDGDRREPIGASTLREGKQLLLQPALYTIMRVNHRDERETSHLRAVRPLVVGERRKISALPSSVVEGAILWNFELELKRVSADVLTCDLGRVTGLSDTTIAGARRWIEAFISLCRGFELDPPATYRGVIKYWKPAKPPAATALQRLVVALRELGGTAHQSKVVAFVDERFGGNVRTNNTRREVRRNPTLLEFDEARPRVLRLLPEGDRLAQAFIRAGGLPRKPRVT